MTKAELRTRVLTDFGSDLSSATVDAIIFERYTSMVVEAKYREATVTLGQTVAAQSEYALSDDYADVLRLSIGTSEYERIGGRDMAGLRSGRLHFHTSTGIAGVFAPAASAAGAATVELYPVPTVTGTTITAEVAQVPAAFSSDADTPKIPTHLHRYIAYGALAEVLTLSDERFQEADRFEQMFQEGIQKLRRYKTSRVGSGAGQIKVRGVHV